MSAILHRLEAGELRWPAEALIRPLGVTALTLCALMADGLYRLVRQFPPHGPRPIEFLAALAVFLSFSVGLALLLEGPGLFRPVPLPPRPLTRIV